MVKQLDAVYAALADPTRRQMVERLRARDLTVSELAEPLTMTLAAVGKHIAVLERANIIRTRKTGRVRSCTVIPHAFADAAAWIADQERFWNDRIDALAAHLDEVGALEEEQK